MNTASLISVTIPAPEREPVRWHLDVELYDGGRVFYPLPEDFTWEDARRTRTALKSQDKFKGRIYRCSILSQHDQRPRQTMR